MQCPVWVGKCLGIGTGRSGTLLPFALAAANDRCWRKWTFARARHRARVTLRRSLLIQHEAKPSLVHRESRGRLLMHYARCAGPRSSAAHGGGYPLSFLQDASRSLLVISSGSCFLLGIRRSFMAETLIASGKFGGRPIIAPGLFCLLFGGIDCACAVRVPN